MKKLIYTIALVMIGITASNAQELGKRKAPAREGRDARERVEVRRSERHDKLTSEQRAERAANVMQRRLALTDEQKQKVKEIELTRAKKHEEWRKQDEKAMKSKMKDRKAFMESSRERIERILTEEQRKTLASSREGLKEKMRDHKGKRPDRPSLRTPQPAPSN
ncbi:hypothetical protein [Pedobacter insulae]|uniref:LTXXQ motif family protein n=1 Tax=Pedobacter insulae TaxID=414048 RepID=A0A1I2YLB5_9SPHI|nr:hypothetical protein [Pedobacter insulae]SFH25846.1 hypothetical protein SAMN04489864_107146 [Pedobacter insulae]